MGILALALGAASALVRAPARMGTPCGINGFGRIGRLVARIIVKNPETDLVLINSGASAEYMAYQMKYDSIHGVYPGTIEIADETLVIDGNVVPLSHPRDPA